LSFDAVERIAISADARRRGDDVEDEDGDEGERRRLSRGVATWRVDPAPLCVSSASHPPSLPPALPVLLPPSCLLFGLFPVCSSGSPLLRELFALSFSLACSRSSDSPPTHCITVRITTRPSRQHPRERRRGGCRSCDKIAALERAADPPTWRSTRLRDVKITTETLGFPARRTAARERRNLARTGVL